MEGAAAAPRAPARPVNAAAVRGAERSRPAGFWLRCWAWIYDTTLLSIIVAVLGLLVKFAFGVAIVALVMKLIENGLTGSFGAMLALGAIFFGWIGAIVVSWLVGQLVGWLYYAFFESSGARATPGKRLLSLWVVDAENERISFWRATLRHIWKFAPLFPAMLAFLYLVDRMRAPAAGGASTAGWLFATSLLVVPLLFFIFYGMAGWNRDRRALHDILSGCYVVRSKELSSNRQFGLALGSVAFFLVVWIASALFGIYRSATVIEERTAPEPSAAATETARGQPAPVAASVGPPREFRARERIMRDAGKEPGELKMREEPGLGDKAIVFTEGDGRFVRYFVLRGDKTIEIEFWKIDPSDAPRSRTIAARLVPAVP